MNDERTGGWHQLNIGHLVMGLAFAGIVGIWALVQTDTVAGDDVRWLLPIPWVVAGVAGLAATAVTGSRRYAVRQVGWVGPADADPEPAVEPVEEPSSETADTTATEETAPVTRRPDAPTAAEPEDPENPAQPENPAEPENPEETP